MLSIKSSPYIYMLADCNSFYVSCERLFAPHLQNKPVIVLSNNDGCVIARSSEAKMLGIQMADPYFLIKDFCKKNNVAIFSPNFALYGNLSERIMSLLRDLAPEIQIYSIDEAFLRFSSNYTEEKLIFHANYIKKQIAKLVGIPISIGIGSTKTLAKLANNIAKKSQVITGVFSLLSPTIKETILKESSVEDIWGIGKGFAKKLQDLRIYTAKDIESFDLSILQKHLGVLGAKIGLELRGISALTLEEVENKKSIACTRSFAHTLDDKALIEEALSTYVYKAAQKMRKQKSYTSSIQIFLEYISYEKTIRKKNYSSLTVRFQVPTNDTLELISASKKGLRSLYQKGIAYKKCGVILLDLVQKNQIVPDFFLPNPDPKKEHLMYVMDTLQKQYGNKGLFVGSMGVNDSWQAKSNMRSNLSLTNPIFFPTVKAN